MLPDVWVESKANDFMNRFPGLVILVLLLCSDYATADWRQFRGNNSAGVVETAVPVEFGPGKNELWSVPLGAGHSSPIVVGDAIYLTTFDRAAKQVAVVKLNRRDGSVAWDRPIPLKNIERGHPSFNPASSTPACDGERVVAYFGSLGLISFTVDGEEEWRIEMPLTKSYAGNATSPAIIGDKVILYRGNMVDHFLLAVNKKTGDELWKVPQSEPFVLELACTSCPIIAGDKLIVHSARSVQAFEIESGKRIWVTKCATTATSTPVLAGDEVIVAAWNKMGEPALRPEFPTFNELVAKHDKDGDLQINPKELPRMWIFHRPEGAEAPQNGAPLGFRRVDHDKNGQISSDEWARQLAGITKFREGYNTHGLLAIPLNGKGILGQDQVRTLATQAIPEVPSPLYHDGLVYSVKNGGAMICVDVAAGKVIAKLRTKGRGTHYASPFIAGDKLYSTAGDGTISVISLGREPKVLRVNKMSERTYATPAVSDGVLYVRTHGKLCAFAINR